MMDRMAIPMKNIPGLPALVRDYFEDFRRVGDYFGGDFRDPGAFSSLAESVRRRRVPRA
jgi:hypothetical protein